MRPPTDYFFVPTPLLVAPGSYSLLWKAVDDLLEGMNCRFYGGANASTR
jgi:hypothetical protein